MVICVLPFVDSDLFIVRCKLRNVSCQKWTASALVLEVSKAVLSRLGSVWTPFWNRLEASWAALETSWRRLGGSNIPQNLVLEGYSLGKTSLLRIGLHRIKGNLSFLKDFGCPSLSKWRQNWPKIDTKTGHQVKTFLSTLTDRFLRQNWDQNQAHF